MSSAPRFDVWLHRLAGTAAEPPDQALSRVFDIPIEAARAIVSALPSVVKRDADAGLAERIAAALGAIGGQAELRAAQASTAARPGGVPDSAATLKLGTQDLRALWPQHVAVSTAPTLPETEARPLDLAVPSPAPAQAAHARRPAPGRVSLRAPDVFGPSGAPAPLAHGAAVIERHVALDPHARWQHPLQLPAEGAVADATAPMRAPSARSRPAPRRADGPQPEAQAPRVAKARHVSMDGVRDLLQDAAHSGWPNALQRRPNAGFLLVLAGAAAAFLGLIAVL